MALTVHQAAGSLWGDYRGGERNAMVVAVSTTSVDGVPHIVAWVRGSGPKPPIPNPWQGFPVIVHTHATHDKFGVIPPGDP